MVEPETPSERQASIVMAVDLTDPASRMRARQTLEELESGCTSPARTRVLDRRILSLAQADGGGDRISTELAQLATKARELDASCTRPRRGRLGRLFGSSERNLKPIRATLQEIDGIIRTLSESAEVLRQNDVALRGYEADIAAETRRVQADIERADEFHAALTQALEKARAEGVQQEIIRFAESEVLFPLEFLRQHLQSLLSVDQQATISLTILRETNAMLINSVRQITLVTRNCLDTAVALRLSAPLRTAARRQPATSSMDADTALQSLSPAGMSALDDSLDELFRALEAHDAWRGQAIARTEDALDELRTLSEEML